MLLLIALVACVDVVFVVLYFALGFGRAGSGSRTAFTAVWTAASLAAVLVGLTRVRRARVVTGRHVRHD